MASQTATTMVRDQYSRYCKAKRYLDTCGELTFEKFQKVFQIAGADVSYEQLRAWWRDGQNTLPTGGLRGGKDGLRDIARQNIDEGISVCRELAAKTGVTLTEPGDGPGAFVTLVLLVGLLYVVWGRPLGHLSFWPKAGLSLVAFFAAGGIGYGVVARLLRKSAD